MRGQCRGKRSVVPQTPVPVAARWWAAASGTLPDGGHIVVKTSLYQPVAGIFRDDIARFNLALAGVNYPAEKWQLIAHAERDPVGRGRPDPRTIRQLWALPAGRYPGLDQVLASAAWTSRGHPSRSGEAPIID